MKKIKPDDAQALVQLVTGDNDLIVVSRKGLLESIENIKKEVISVGEAYELEDAKPAVARTRVRRKGKGRLRMSWIDFTAEQLARANKNGVITIHVDKVFDLLRSGNGKKPNRNNMYNSLTRLSKQGYIRRVKPGVYNISKVQKAVPAD